MENTSSRDGSHRASSSHHHNRERKVVSVLRTALLSVWTLAILISFILDVVADVFQADTPTFPLVPVIGTGIGLQVIATSVSAIYGCATIRNYRLFQPFAGGQTFVFTQCAGYCFGVLVAVAKVLLLEMHPHNPDAQRRRLPADAVLFRTPYGAFTSLGLFTLLSQVLLMTSHRYFKRPSHAVAPASLTASASQTVAARSWRSSISQLPYRDYLLVLVCDAVVFLCTVLAAYQPTFRPVNVAALFTFTTVKVFLLQFSTAPSIAPSYRLFQPFTHGAPYRLMTLQCTADLLLLVFYVDVVVLYQAGASALPSWHMHCALIGMIATTIHAVLLRLLQFVWQNFRVMADKAAQGHTDETSATAPSETSSLGGRTQDENISAMTDLQKVALSGPASIFSTASVTLALFVFWDQSFLDVFPLPTSIDSERGLHLIVQFVTVVLFMLPPLTFLQGGFLYGKRFSLWESYRGSLDYLGAQVGGWWCYGAAFFCAVLQATQSDMSPSLALLATACLLFSQLLIHTALYLFADEAVEADKVVQQASASDAVSTTGSPSLKPARPHVQTSMTDSVASAHASPRTLPPSEERTALACVLNIEMLAAMAAMLVSLLLRLVYDMVEMFAPLSDGAGTLKPGQLRSPFELRGGVYYFMGTTPTTSFLSLSRWLALVAPVVAHLSMRDRIPLLHGSSLANGYVALQTLGWLFYIVTAASTVTHDFAGVPLFVMPWLGTATVPTVCMWGYEVTLKSTEAVTGLLYGMPFLFIFWSNLVETSFDIVRSRMEQQVARSVDNLLSVVAQHETSPAVLQRCANDIDVIAGPRLGQRQQHSLDGTYRRSAAQTREEEADRMVLADAAHYTTILTTLATVAASGFAFVASDTQQAMALLLSTAALLVGAFACGALQVVYGPRYHRRSGGFVFFMPLVGGRRFVLRQACGWVSLAVCVCTMIACYLEQHVSHLVIAVSTVTNVLAQWIICESIPHFNPEARKDLTGTFLGTYAEAILAIVTLIATLFAIHFYTLATEKNATSQMASLVPLVFSSIAMCLVIPFGLLSLQRQAVIYGLPNPLRYTTTTPTDSRDVSPLGDSRTAGGDGAARTWSQPDLTAAAEDGAEDDDDAGDDDVVNSDDSSDDDDAQAAEAAGAPATASHSAMGESLRRVTASGTALDASVMTPLFARWNSSVGPWDLPSASQPGSPLHVPGSPTALRRRRRRQRRARQNALWMRAVYILASVLAIFVALLIPFGLMFIAYAYVYATVPTLEAAVSVLRGLLLAFAGLIILPILFKSVVERSRAVRNVHSAVCCFTIYSIPTITVLVGTAPGPIFNTRGAWLFTLNMVLLAIFSTLPHVLVTSFVFIVSSLGYFVHYHFYQCLYEHKHPFIPAQCASDLGMAFFWLWYSRRYLGRPHMTGRLQSDAISRFFRRNFFEGMSYYFSLRVIRSEPYVLPQERGKLGDHEHANRVDLSNPDNQYLFSFHPHGVFPGSAMFVPKTTLWEKTVGHNKKNFISTHCADIVFSVPLMREFPLTLGAMSVSRRGIENSLKRGNSPLIVTGGQAEMLLTCMSDTEMHLVCHHLGFIKIALQNKVPLVPLLSFSESNILDNVHCVRVQRWFLKRIGFPFPTLPRGRWGLPLPTSKPLTMLVGQPIYPLPGRDDPTDPSCLDELRTRYFEHLEVLFYKYRAEAGYPDMKLYLHNGVYNEAVLAVPPVVTPVATHPKGASPDRTDPPRAVEAEEEEEEDVLTRQNSAVRRAMAMPSRGTKPRAPEKKAA